MSRPVRARSALAGVERYPLSTNVEIDTALDKHSLRPTITGLVAIHPLLGAAGDRRGPPRFRRAEPQVPIAVHQAGDTTWQCVAED